MDKKMIRSVVSLILVVIGIEVLFFNRQVIFSAFTEETVTLSYEVGDSLTHDKGNDYKVSRGNTPYFQLSGMNSELNYMYIDIECIDEDGSTVPVNMHLSVVDEGNSKAYDLADFTVYDGTESSKYISAHSYGNVKELRLYVEADENDTIRVNSIVYNAKVPMMISSIRLVIIFGVCMLIWCFKSTSDLYEVKWNKREKMLLIAIIFLMNGMLWYYMSDSNTKFQDPSWTHHHQYHKLAVALSKGEVSLDIGNEDIISELENPYDRDLRQEATGYGMGPGWDTAFYEGEYYVYFGIVPVLVFYLPYYLINGTEFPTWYGVLITSLVTYAGVFYLLHQIIKKYFKNVSFSLYLLLCVMMGNGMGSLVMNMRADFYMLPIAMALAFTIWGLGLWISAAEQWDREIENGDQVSKGLRAKLLLGSLCMALVAGCRPQFLVGSFLIFFIFGKHIKYTFKNNKGSFVKRALMVIVPYAIVAAGLMYYNYIRFGSVLEFGAQYNLTTNDMTKRGFNLDRLWDGIYMYLFQFPKTAIQFPFVFPTDFKSDYLGKTIRENMFGGIFFTNIIFLVLILVRKLKAELKEKGLYGLTCASIIFGFIIVIADTQMAGILARYYADFKWIFMIAAFIIVLVLWEKSEGRRYRGVLITFVLAAFIWSMFMEWGMGFTMGNYVSYNVPFYFEVKAVLGL